MESLFVGGGIFCELSFLYVHVFFHFFNESCFCKKEIVKLGI